MSILLLLINLMRPCWIKSSWSQTFEGPDWEQRPCFRAVKWHCFSLCKLASFVPRSQTTPCCRTQGVCPTVWECVCRRETRPREISHLCLTCLCWSCTQTLFPVSWSKSCLQLTFIILFARSRTFRVSVKLFLCTLKPQEFVSKNHHCHKDLSRVFGQSDKRLLKQ